MIFDSTLGVCQRQVSRTLSREGGGRCVKAASRRRMALLLPYIDTMLLLHYIEEPSPRAWPCGTRNGFSSPSPRCPGWPDSPRGCGWALIVLVVPYRHPLVMARMAGNLDELSAGASWCSGVGAAGRGRSSRRSAVTGATPSRTPTTAVRLPSRTNLLIGEVNSAVGWPPRPGRRTRQSRHLSAHRMASSGRLSQHPDRTGWRP